MVTTLETRSTDWPIVHRLIDVFARVAINRGQTTVWGTVTACSIAFIGLWFITVENSFINYFKKSTVTHQELMYIDQEFGGSVPLDVIYKLPDGPSDSSLILPAEVVRLMQAMQLEMSDVSGVGKLMSVVNLTQLAKEVNGGRPITEYELSAAYQALDEALREQLIGSFLSVKEELARISLRIQDTTNGIDRSAVIQSIHEKMAGLGVDKGEYQITGLFALYQDLLQRLFLSQVYTIGIVFAGLFACFALVFRLFKVAIIAIVPNLVSTLIVLGTMGWMGIPLDFMTITIASVAMGIAVDDTIHYTHRFLDESSGLDDNKEAIRRTHRSVGLAILYTTIVIVAGFSLLGLSDFVPSILFGLLTALSVLIALLTDFCLLPHLLSKIKNDGGGKQLRKGNE